MDREELILVLKAQQWEKCKGELRSLLALTGSHKSTSSEGDIFVTLEDKIEEFITYIEDNEFHE